MREEWQEDRLEGGGCWIMEQPQRQDRNLLKGVIKGRFSSDLHLKRKTLGALWGEDTRSYCTNSDEGSWAVEMMRSSKL